MLPSRTFPLEEEVEAVEEAAPSRASPVPAVEGEEVVVQAVEVEVEVEVVEVPSRASLVLVGEVEVLPSRVFPLEEEVVVEEAVPSRVSQAAAHRRPGPALQAARLPLLFSRAAPSRSSSARRDLSSSGSAGRSAEQCPR